MAVRDDISVDFFESPRIVRVAAPSTELTIQDLHDTVRAIEDEPNKLQYPDLISSAGKEPLGGGITVGITSTLKDAQVSFEARKASTSSGTVTTADASGRTLIDSAATFVSDGVERGAWVVNLTDGSVASVTRVVSETQLVTDVLGDGLDGQFEIGDSYKVWNVIGCQVSGGNLVAQDENGATIAQILPTAGTQVRLTASSSATLQELLDIQYSAFLGAVHVDPASPYDGTSFPTGTPRQKVNNVDDALLIAASRGFHEIMVHGDLTITQDISDFFVYGSRRTVTLTIGAGGVVQGSRFADLTLQGSFDGLLSMTNCVLLNCTNVTGFIEDSFLDGRVTLGGMEIAHFVNCKSGPQGLAVIDGGGSFGQDVAIRDYTGDLAIENVTGGNDEWTIDLDSSDLLLAADVTAGTFILRGIGLLTDLSGGSATVTDELLSGTRQILLEKILRNESYTDPTTGEFVLLDDDNVTELFRVNLWEDVAKSQAYQGQGAERRERLE